jgi:diguanylate cyclase (GGDEF)-like protein/PAS domain S-box-containing protein
MMLDMFRRTIARKLLLAFFLVFIFTYLATALVVQNAVRSSVTDSEVATLSQLAQLKLGSLNARFEQLSTNLRAWAKLDVMNDIASGDVDKRVEHTLESLAKDYALDGEIYVFNAAGHLVASSDLQHNIDILPVVWKLHGQSGFVNKHPSPVDGEDIVAMVFPIRASFSEDYQLGTIVMANHWSGVRATLPDQTLLLYHQHSPTSQESAPITRTFDKSPPDMSAHQTSIILMDSMLDVTVPDKTLPELAHLNGWVQVGNNPYLVNSAMEDSGLLAGWEIVMLREPGEIYQTVHEVILKLAILGLILTLPLILVIRWLARRLTAPLRQLTQFVSEITGTDDLSKRLKLDSNDEIGVLASNFNRMTARLESGSKAHREAETRLRATIDNALDAVVQVNSEGIILGWNDQAFNIFGWPREEAVGRLLHELIIPPRYREEHLNDMQHLLAIGEGRVLNSRIEKIGLHRDGHEFPVEWAITTIEVEGCYEISAFIRDITHKKESEELIWKQANFDKVTGLPNRHMFHDRLEQEIKKASRSGQQISLLFIDLDRFKEINDTLGHDAGDILLVETAHRIRNCVRESDSVARFGGDEFTVTLLEVDDTSDVERVALCILEKLTEPFQLKDEVVYISASIGITIFPNDATSVEDLLKNADQAMYVSKSKGRNQSSYYTSALQDAAQERRRLINDLRDALAGNQFLVYFQPIMDMGTGRIQKAEALLRWKHPERGLVSPREFIMVAEETGLINEIGDWVFKESARWAKRWTDLYSHDFQISVNVSPIQFHSGGHFCDEWEKYLRDINLAGKSIAIEITESLLLNASKGVTYRLLRFRDSGIQVAVDDFGTGYSSLSYLKKFDIDYLKIDKSFVDNLETDVNDMVLSEAIIVMAHKLGLKVIAEGVETGAQRNLLSKAGCDYAQGYLFSNPVTPEEFEDLLKTSM